MSHFSHDGRDLRCEAPGRQPCRSAATDGEFCAYHAALADQLGPQEVVNGDQVKQRNARQRVPVVAESEPLELSAALPGAPSGVRPALALTAAEEVETIRRVLLEAATSTTRDTWATCTCPECGKSFRQEISVPDHGARIKAVETLLREGLGRVGEAEFVEPRMPTTVDEVKDLSMDELALVIAKVVRERDPRCRRRRGRRAPLGTRAVGTGYPRDVGSSPRRGWLNDHPDPTSIRNAVAKRLAMPDSGRPPTTRVGASAPPSPS